jgi:hypothetical protein
MEILNRVRVLRSKNAGPFILTFDIVLHAHEDFEKIKAGLMKEDIARAYAVDPSDVLSINPFDDLLAIKINIKRQHPSGHPGNSDCYGMNQEEPLARLLDRIIE